MKPSPDILWPSAHEIARVIVAAARAEGEDALAVAEGRARSRARVYAFIILAHRFPTVPPGHLMVKLGADRLKAFPAYIAAIQIARGDDSKNGKWFSLATLNVIVEAVGWPPMTAEDAHVRRVNSKKNPATIRERVESAAAFITTPAPQSTSGMRGLGGVTVPRPVYPGSFSPPDAAPVVSYKPDAPAHERNVDILTAEICGDPPAHRSALHQRMTEEKLGGSRDVHSRR